MDDVIDAGETPPDFSIVIPVYKNEGSIPSLLQALGELSKEWPGRLEVVFVIDGSPDGSERLLSKALPATPFESQLIVLSRNFGAFAAIRQGLAHAQGHAIGIMAADLQEPPTLMITFRDLLRSGEWDVTVGRRTVRRDSVSSTWLSNCYWALYRRLVNPALPPGGVDIFGCTANFKDALLGLEERGSSLIGLVYWLGYRRKEVSYERAERSEGRSAWTFRKRFRYATDGIISFTDIPLRMLTAMGVTGVGFAVVYGSILLVQYCLGGVGVKGFTAIVLIVSFFGSLNLLCMGILGGYISRMFDNTKGRPASVLMRREFYPVRKSAVSDDGTPH